ncbi:MAG: 4Fe-4S dicluster domain-containing protein [Planctomycetota bacterium]
MADYFLSEGALGVFAKAFTRGPLYGTIAREGRSTYERLTPEDASKLAVRVKPPIESLKSLLFPVKERVAVYPAEEPTQPKEEGDSSQGAAVVGTRACELCALEILDAVFLEGDYPDPFYAAKRQATMIISTDCVEPDEFCFCNLVGGKPYPEKSFDLNLSPIDGGYVVRIGSDAGKELVLERANLFAEATPEQCRQRDAQRDRVSARLQEINARYAPGKPLQEALAGKDKTEAWRELASTCVECAACSFICPTCHCFLLYDSPGDGAEDQNERIKVWDSCVLASFAKMAGVGGVKATPRPRLVSRFENRVRHKFEWMYENLGRIGCVGCGRCIDACAGGSDIREVISRLGRE